MSLWYYAHRFRNGGTLGVEDGQANLRRAIERYRRMLRAQPSGRILSAPWIDLALADVGEPDAWKVIVPFIGICQGIVLDMDGETGHSAGMRRERELARTMGIKVEEVA